MAKGLKAFMSRLFSGKEEKRETPSAPAPEKQTAVQPVMGVPVEHTGRPSARQSGGQGETRPPQAPAVTAKKPLREKPFRPVCYYGCPDSNRVRALRTKRRSRIREKRGGLG